MLTHTCTQPPSLNHFLFSVAVSTPVHFEWRGDVAKLDLFSRRAISEQHFSEACSIKLRTKQRMVGPGICIVIKCFWLRSTQLQDCRNRRAGPLKRTSTAGMSCEVPLPRPLGSCFSIYRFSSTSDAKSNVRARVKTKRRGALNTRGGKACCK